MMRVLIPSTHQPAFTGGIVWPINPDKDDAYWSFWRSVWAEARTVIVVEHDVTPSETALKELWECDWPWCAQPYPYIRLDAYYGLGCVKFDTSVMTGFPDLWERVSDFYDGMHIPRHWCRLDAWSAALLYERGYERHHHRIPVDHPIKERSAHGCV